MKLLPRIIFLFNILEPCLSKEISLFGQYEHFLKVFYIYMFYLEKARLRIKNILHGYVEKNGVNFEVGQTDL